MTSPQATAQSPKDQHELPSIARGQASSSRALRRESEKMSFIIKRHHISIRWQSHAEPYAKLRCFGNSAERGRLVKKSEGRIKALWPLQGMHLQNVAIGGCD